MAVSTLDIAEGLRPRKESGHGSAPAFVDRGSLAEQVAADRERGSDPLRVTAPDGTRWCVWPGAGSQPWRAHTAAAAGRRWIKPTTSEADALAQIATPASATTDNEEAGDEPA